MQALGWKLDYKKFRRYLKEKYAVEVAYMFIGYVQRNQRLYASLQKAGFVLIFKPVITDADGNIKGNVDADLVLQVMIDLEELDKAVLVTSDGDFYSLVRYLYELDKLEVVMSPTKRLTVGVELPDRVLGRVAAENPIEYLTGDENLINVRIAVQYAVKDPAAFLFHSQDVAQLIAKSVESAFARTIAAENVESLLTTGKVAAQNATLAFSRELLDAYASGVFISSINIENVTPPAETADAFRESINARADRDRIVNEAQGYANDTSAKAEGEGKKMVTDAESYRQQRINEAEGDAARFAKLLTESRKAKDVTERRLYLETMEEVLPRMKKVVIDSSGGKSLMDLGIISPKP